MDGFIRRDSVPTRSRRTEPKQQEGFNRRSPARQQITFTDEAWSDNDTLTLETAQTDDKPAKKPRFWQKSKMQSKSNNQHQDRKKRIKRTLMGLGVLVVLVGGFMGWKFLSASSKIFDGNVLGFLSTTKLRGEEDGRVNILLAGTSEDDPDHDGAALTDSIILASVDVRNNTAFTTSIPRDLWVTYGEQCSAGFAGKINNAYQCGETIKFNEPGYPKGGMGLLSKVVSENFGIPIQYYGKIDYTAFRDAVDAVGGIKITIKSDDPRGIYDPNIQPRDGGPVRHKNGPVTLDGISALALARSRNAAGGYGLTRGDFDRTMYQREMLIALKDKALSVGVISNPAKIGGLLDAAGDNVATNFNTGELRRLYEISKLVDSKNISSVDMADPDIGLVKTGAYNGQSIVLPSAGLTDYSDIKVYFKKLTSTDPVVLESASIAVLNGSGTTGLATKWSDKLEDKGLIVDSVANASSDRAKTIVIDLTSVDKKPKTKEYLAKTFATTVTTDRSAHPEASQYDVDFIVILGKSATTPSQ